MNKLDEMIADRFSEVGRVWDELAGEAADDILQQVLYGEITPDEAREYVASLEDVSAANWMVEGYFYAAVGTYVEEGVDEAYEEYLDEKGE